MPTKTEQQNPEQTQPTGALPYVEHPSLAAALSAFQGEVPPVRKGNTAKVQAKSGASYEYAYADLSDIHEIIDPYKARHGLSFTGSLTLTKHGFGLRWKLRHVSGEMEKGFYPLPDPSTFPPQEAGKLQTYARRYVECAALGIAPGGDDDDASSAQTFRAQQQHAQQQARQGGTRQPARQRASAPERVQMSEDEWIARLNAAPTLEDAVNVWRESRGNAPADVTDKLAILCQERKLAEEERAAAEAGPEEVAA